jgi:phosphopantothenoylcysteine decarboxylase
VASIKAREIISGLSSLNVNVIVIPTKNSLHFLDLPEFNIDNLLSNNSEKPIVAMFKDEDEWYAWTKREDFVLHIELRKISSMLLIAPLSANTLGKLANGLCDNLLTSVARCWDIKQPLIVAPAMNTLMYEHPITEVQLKFLSDTLKIKVLPTINKKLMCGDEGFGAMIDVKSIIDVIASHNL